MGLLATPAASARVYTVIKLTQVNLTPLTFQTLPILPIPLIKLTHLVLLEFANPCQQEFNAALIQTAKVEIAPTN